MDVGVGERGAVGGDEQRGAEELDCGTEANGRMNALWEYWIPGPINALFQLWLVNVRNRPNWAGPFRIQRVGLMLLRHGI